jgi:hypothetical protein
VGPSTGSGTSSTSVMASGSGLIQQWSELLWRLSGDSMADGYSWIKVVHVLAVISWMAGLFYLPRLFVYHAENMGKSELVSVSWSWNDGF